MNNEFPPDPCKTDRPSDRRAEKIRQTKEASVSFACVQEAYNRTFRARPRELIVCLNGYPRIRRMVEPSAETVISFWSDEAIDFVEVLNEEGLRLAYMDIEQQNLEDRPERGRVPLSEGRALELSVFRDPTGRIRVEVIYRDPSKGM